MKVSKRHAVIPKCCVCKRDILDREPYWYGEHFNIEICVKCAPFDNEKEAAELRIEIKSIEDYINLVKRY